jgi:hypothetical protein
MVSAGRAAAPCRFDVGVHNLGGDAAGASKDWLGAQMSFESTAQKKSVHDMKTCTPASGMAQGDVDHRVSTFKNRENLIAPFGARAIQCTRYASDEWLNSRGLGAARGILRTCSVHAGATLRQ